MALLIADTGVRSELPPFLKICQTDPAIMELGTVIPYLKNIKKIM